MKRNTALSTTLAIMALAGSASADTFSFTADADWDTGSYSSTNSGPPGADNQIQIDPVVVTQFDFMWVAASGRDSAVLIDTDHVDLDGVSSLADSAGGSGAILGEYRTAPLGQPGNPSRTTVDLNGDVWIGNRNAAIGGGSVVKITSTPGVGTTSSGTWNGTTFDQLAWTNAGGADTNGGTSTAQDVAIQVYARTDSTNNRTVAVDANNDVWVGGLGNRYHQKLDGTTGAQIGTTSTVQEGGYGGVIDGNGILWSSDWSSSTIARYDTTAADPGSSYIGSVATGGPSYGLAVDNSGNIWNSHFSSGTISKLDSSGSLIGTFSLGLGSTQSRGVAVTPDNHIWVANSATNNVTRLDNNGNVVQHIAVGDFPTGVSVDSNGKVWVTNYNSNSVMRIDPATNAVDLTVELGAGATPYNYSDMTGSLVGGITNPTGIWLSGAIDGGAIGTLWDKVFWNEEAEGTVPAGASITVQVRAADTIAGLSGITWTDFSSGDNLGLTGQFSQIRTILTRSGTLGAANPILSDVRLTTGVVPLPASVWLLFGSMVALFGIRRRRA